MRDLEGAQTARTSYNGGETIKTARELAMLERRRGELGGHDIPVPMAPWEKDMKVGLRTKRFLPRQKNHV